jgi:hypothetical protein
MIEPWDFLEGVSDEPWLTTVVADDRAVALLETTTLEGETWRQETHYLIWSRDTGIDHLTHLTPPMRVIAHVKYPPLEIAVLCLAIAVRSSIVRTVATRERTTRIADIRRTTIDLASIMRPPPCAPLCSSTTVGAQWLPDSDLRRLPGTLEPKARDDLHRVLIRDNADRDAICQLYGWPQTFEGVRG